MKALILAAGKGTRLGGLTLNRPKPMLPIGGMALLEHHLRWLRAQGITEIAINVHHAHEAITSYFGNGDRFGISIHYSHEETLLGTAGAAKRLQGFLDQPFVVVYGDVFTNLKLPRLLRFHQTQVKKHALAQSITLALYQVPNPTECGLVELDADGQILSFVEKPAPDQLFTNLANSGIMVCETAVIDAIPPDTVFDFGHDLFPKLLEAKIPLFGQEIVNGEFVIDIGTPFGYQRAQEKWAQSTANLIPAT